jgi:hypothetical protein
VPEPITVYRGFAVAGHEWKVGESFAEPGFCSTTIARDNAERFADRAEGGAQVLAKIDVPAGVEVAPLQELAEFPGEEELVLPRGSRFEVLATDGRTVRLRFIAAG